MSIENKNMLGALLVACSLFSFWSFLVPEYQKISGYKTAIEEREKIFQERKAILDNLKALENEYNSKGSQIKSISTIVPTKKEISELIVAIEAIARDAGMAYRGVTFGEGKPFDADGGMLVPVSIDIDLEGTYDGVLKLLANLEQNSRIIDVMELSFSPSEGSQIIFQVSFQGQAFFIQ